MNKPIEDDDFLAIDEFRLDREWLGQARRYFQYSEKLADARRRLDEAKAALDVSDAELDAEIRLNPSEFGLGKPTEQAVKNAVTASPEHQAAERKVIRAKHDVAIFDAAVTALDHRRRALEKLVDLQLSGYYAEPRARNEHSREAIGEAEKQAARGKGRRRQPA